MPTPIAVPSSASWRVRDAADNLLERRGLRSTELVETKTDDVPEMTISKYFDVDTCQARLRRDKTAIVKMALDAAASAILENLHKADDDENEKTTQPPEESTGGNKKLLPSLLEDIQKLQEMRVESMERAHANKDLGKRRLAVAKEQEKEKQLKAKQNKGTGVKTEGTSSGKLASDGGTNSSKASSTGKKANAADKPIKAEAGAASTTGTTSTKKEEPKKAPAFTRNTPASSASALEARLTGSRAILCTAANVAFNALTPPLPELEAIDVADVPQNPANTVDAVKTEESSSTGKTSTVPDMGPVIIEAQKMGKRIENVATNAVRRSRRRFQFRKDNIRYQENGNTKSVIGGRENSKNSGFRVLKNPFAWKDSDDESDGSPMDVDERATIVTNDSATDMDCNNTNETWDQVCIPRLLSILQTGVGNAILHDVLWSTRYGRIANLLHEISMLKPENDSTVRRDASTDRNFGPHLIVTVEPDVDKFAKEFKAPNSHLRLMSTVEEASLRALAYKGTKSERRRLRQQFPQATGLQDASFHVIIVSYANFLKDYIHFCQTPFEVVILDDGVSWMAAANNDPNSPIATIWEDALFSKNDHQMGLAGTTTKDWDYSADTIDEEIMKDIWIGLTARHRLVTSSKIRVDNPRSPADLLPVPGLLSFTLPHFSDAVKEEWDRSRISNDASSMNHLRKLLTRSLVVHDPNSSTNVVKTEDGETETPQDVSIYKLATKTLMGEMPESVRSKNFPTVPKQISDEEFIADGKVASSRRSALQWLGSIEDSWLRYELGSVSFQHIILVMKNSLNYGYICEEITTASSTTTGSTGQIMGTLAFKLGLRSGKSFSSEQGLRQHITSHHAPPGTWLCRTCKMDCVTSQARTHHERSCGQPSSTSGTSSALAASGESKKGAGKKKGKSAKSGASSTPKDAPTSSTTGLGGGVVPALSVVNIKDLPPDVKPLLRDPRQTSRTGGNSKRHVYAYRGVCRQARKGHDRWQSQISFLGVNHYLGTFDSEWDAAAIYGKSRMETLFIYLLLI